ncbi:YdeI/OmpD-associated family protein [Agromyces mediolanus]|uniref:YdeI/OmpD-associated family protein n=1 Tax=Agromyces mediolanus TaxID=41986 RepID=UPI001E36589C|nr:YdeI/OmpD-associated family protein [Agromyces mediolanus]MCD1572539.1 YdeI/OmpD-associated family protein [Agromyces mediolanus]
MTTGTTAGASPARPELLNFEEAAEWEAWLERNGDAGEAWLRIAKRGRAGLAISDALDVALCFGWIDSIRRGNDDASFAQRYSPRRAGSPWSAINVERAEALEAAGRMRPGGLAQLASARADGRWDAAYVRQRDATVPEDLAAALAAVPLAERRFEALGKTRQYALVLPLLKARTAEGRAARITKLVAELGDLRGASAG